MPHKVAFCRADIAKRERRRRNSKALVKLTEKEGMPQPLICEFDEVVQSRWRKVRSRARPKAYLCKNFQMTLRRLLPACGLAGSSLAPPRRTSCPLKRPPPLRPSRRHHGVGVLPVLPDVTIA